MKSFMERHQIDTLFHFTQASNLPNIFKYGLLPKETLLSNRIEAEFNDHYRYDKCEDALCMSIEFPNYKMFYSLRMNDKNVDWAVLKLDASILLDFDCAYCVTNAGSAESYSLALEERKGRRAFFRLFDDYQGKPGREEMKIKPWFPTNPQAEVLVFDCIPLHYIDAVFFESRNVLREYERFTPDVIKLKVSPSLFSYREDWSYW